MKKIIESYNKILKSKGYVQITSDELHLSSQIEYKLRNYNRHSNKMKSVKLDLPLNAKLTKLKNLLDKESQPDVEELVSLLELKQLFDSNDIKENEIKKKRNYIKSQLEATNSGINLNIMDSDILYDETRVHFEKIDSLVKFSNKLEKYKLLHTNVYFRGQQNLNWSVLPSIFRGNWINHEKDFVHEMLISNPQDFANLNTTLGKLTKMQHYNAPTRLLDITSNPYIALYFACEKDKASDFSYSGEVLFFQSKETEKYYDSDTVSIVSNLAMMKDTFDIGNDKLEPEDFCEQGDIPYLLHQIKFEKPTFLNIINPADLHKCFVVHVPLDNKRILNQQGLFLLVGMGKSKAEPASIEDSILKNNDKKLLFLIPDKNKEKILDELDAMNINKRFIYPEIDDVADFLKNQKFKQ